MGLSIQERKLLYSALVDAFPTFASLEKMLSSLCDKNLSKITRGNDLNEIIFNLIQDAEANNWVIELIQVAMLINPRNLKLHLLSFHQTFKESPTVCIFICSILVLFVIFGLWTVSTFFIFCFFYEYFKVVTKPLQSNIETTFIKPSQSNFEPSKLWSFQYCSLILNKFLNDRQREEWTGDLEEVLYKMYDNKYLKWQIDIEMLRRTFVILKSLFIVKLIPSSSTKKSIK